MLGDLVMILTRRCGRRITLLHVAEEISLMIFPHCASGHWCIPGYFCNILAITFSLQYPQKKKSSGFRSGDRGAHKKSLLFEMFSDVRADFGLSVRSRLQIVPVSLNLLTTFIIHLLDGVLLTLKYFLNILCVATTELEAINS